MANGILGLGSKGSTGLNAELITKLKDAEAKAKVDPYTKKLEKWDKESEKITDIKTKVTELLSKISSFDLYAKGANAFEQVTASTAGKSAIFDAVDVSGLESGSTTVNITQLAQRDVYQTATFSNKDVQVDGGDDNGDKITIKIGSGNDIDFTTEGKTYQELASDINDTTGLTASVEQVGDDSYRLVIKSTDSGVDNAFTIIQDGVDLGLATTLTSKYFDSTTDALEETDASLGSSKITININSIDYDIDTHNKSLEDVKNDINNTANLSDDIVASISNNRLVLTNKDSLNNYEISVSEDNISMGFSDAILQAQNMNATVDGLVYDVSSNMIKIQGNLTMTAIETGKSTISVQKDNSQIMPKLQEFVTSYNELVSLVDDELYDANSPINDSSSLRMMMGDIKNKLFGTYGASGNESIFNYGFSIDKGGLLSIDTEVFGKSLSSDFDKVKDLFIGSAEKEGLGTQLKSYLDNLDSYDGLLTKYGETMGNRKISLEKEKELAQDSLDSKYSLMAQQFASYTALITQMEASFGGMKRMMDTESK